MRTSGTLEDAPTGLEHLSVLREVPHIGGDEVDAAFSRRAFVPQGHRERKAEGWSAVVQVGIASSVTMPPMVRVTEVASRHFGPTLLRSVRNGNPGDFIGENGRRRGAGIHFAKVLRALFVALGFVEGVAVSTTSKAHRGIA